MKIKLTVDNKELELELNKSTELERLSVISNVFQMMGVRDDLSEMVEDYVKIGRAYDSFYRKEDKSEITLDKPIEKDDKILTKKKEIKKETKKEEKPDHYKSGIIEDNGKELYKCRLHCRCGNNQNVYIEQGLKDVNCPDCNQATEVRNAKKVGFPERDSWGNYYIAGGFVGEDER